MRHKLSLFLVTLALLVSGFVRKPETGFLDRSVTVDGTEYKYQVYVPRAWTKHEKWPVMLFLNGSGERGTDGILQTEVGIGTALRRYADRFPMIVVLPQLPPERDWLDEITQKLALEALERAVKEFKGDRDRLYLTGLSLGGYGTWSIAARHPGMFAALAPVCGGVISPDSPDRGRSRKPYQEMAAGIGKVPVWIFHGGVDPSVPPEESRIMFEEVAQAGGVVRYYEFEGVGHESWDPAYEDPEFPRWLLSQRRSENEKVQPSAERKLIPLKPGP